MLEILKYPDPRLKQVSKPVTEFGPKLHTLLDEMAVAMYAANGVGLAAPQVGELQRLFLIDVGTEEKQDRKLYEFINPKLSDGQGKIAFEEGCLSVPGVTEEVWRKEQITVTFQDRNGKERSMTALDLLA